jgi:protein MpaA
VSDYQNVVDRLDALPESVSVRILEQISEYPVFAATVNVSNSEFSLWINAGTHGDEPAPVEAVLRFLETPCDTLPANIQIVVTPCLNPFGYSEGQRENADGIDINWAYKRDDVPEVHLIKGLIRDRRFTAVIDLHEDWESPGFYLYEQFRNRLSLGEAITDRVRGVCPVNDALVIEGEDACRGVIHPNLEALKRREGEGVPVEVFNEATDHQITTESPSGLPVETRVQAQLAAIDVLLETFSR